MFGLNFELILLGIPGVIVAITLHEWAKSMTAYKLGDKNVKSAGRLAPNPFKHMDILGFFFKVMWGFGWGQPVKLNPFSYKDRKTALVTVFSVAFLANILIGILFAIASTLWFNQFWMDFFQSELHFRIWQVLRLAAVANVSLALLSFVPIYPLSGSFLLNAVAPKASLKMASIEKIAQLILAFFIILGGAAQSFGWLAHRFLSVFMATLFS